MEIEIFMEIKLDQKGNLINNTERTQMSLINPTTKRRKAATGVNYDDEESD